MIQAVIFDVDGTLTDTVDLHAEAWRLTFAEFGHSVPFVDIRGQIGKGGDQLLPVFLSKEEIEAKQKEMEAFRGDLFKREFLPSVRAFPKVRALFEKIRQDGKRIALASSSKEEELKAYVRIMNVGDLIEAGTNSDDAERSKPEPDIFEAALQKLGNPSPGETFVVGDSPYDAEGAEKLGIRSIGLRCGGFPDEDLRRAGFVAIYDSPGELLREIADSPLR